MLVRSDGNRSGNHIMMKAITKEEEEKLDKRNKDDIYFYGDVDPNSEDDIKIIKDYNFVHTGYRSILYKNFDYEAGNFTLTSQFNGMETEHVIKEGACMDPLVWFKYNHCLLGKPAKVVVYNSNAFKGRH